MDTAEVDWSNTYPNGEKHPFWKLHYKGMCTPYWTTRDGSNDFTLPNVLWRTGQSFVKVATEAGKGIVMVAKAGYDNVIKPVVEMVFSIVQKVALGLGIFVGVLIGIVILYFFCKMFGSKICSSMCKRKKKYGVRGKPQSPRDQQEKGEVRKRKKGGGDSV